MSVGETVETPRILARYRDKNTGRFVSKKTWQRSRAKGGQRFKRERIVSKEAPSTQRKPKPRRERLRPRALPKPRKKVKREEREEEEEPEFGGAFDSP